jgi:hypothetical protein
MTVGVKELVEKAFDHSIVKTEGGDVGDVVHCLVSFLCVLDLFFSTRR